MVAPYASTPQIVYFFNNNIVNACACSILSLFLQSEGSQYVDNDSDAEESERLQLNQVLTNIDVQNGTFEWVDKEEMVAGLGMKAEDDIIDMFIGMGGLYGVELTRDKDALFEQMTNEGKSVLLCLGEKDPAALLDFQLVKLVHEISPVLNTDCQLDCLSQKNRQYIGTSMLRDIMGLCFNDEVYFHLSKGLLPQDLLEMLSNQTEISSSSCIVAPSMFLKQIWDSDPDYKGYYE